MSTNPDLSAVNKTLDDIVNRLTAAKVGVTDPDKVKAINNELIELNHRITMVGAVIFHEQTAAITVAAAKVNSAKSDVQAAIKKLDNITSFIKTISAFLGLVDKVVDVAKLVGV